MTQLSLKDDCFLEIINRGPYTELVLVEKNPVIVNPLSNMLISEGGAKFKKGTLISYNALMIKIKEKIDEDRDGHYSNRKVCFGRFNSIGDQQGSRPLSPTGSEHSFGNH